jgi:hypothetical protein
MSIAEAKQHVDVEAPVAIENVCIIYAVLRERELGLK